MHRAPVTKTLAVLVLGRSPAAGAEGDALSAMHLIHRSISPRGLRPTWWSWASAFAPAISGMGSTAAGLEEAAKSDANQQNVMSLVGQRLQEERVALHQRHCLVIKGIAGIQAGKKIDALVAKAKQWAEQQAAALPSASTPSPTTSPVTVTRRSIP